MTHTQKDGLVSSGYAAEVGVNVSSFIAAAHRGTVPFLKVGERTYFDVADVHKFADKVHGRYTGGATRVHLTLAKLLEIYGESEVVGRKFPLDAWKEHVRHIRGEEFPSTLKVETVEVPQEKLVASLRPGQNIKVTSEDGTFYFASVETVHFDERGESAPALRQRHGELRLRRRLEAQQQNRTRLA